MEELYNELLTILYDKVVNLTPDNILKNTSVLNINGTFDPSENITIKGAYLYNTAIEMTASTGHTDGDIAVIGNTSNFLALYMYTASSWSLAPTQLTTEPYDVLAGKYFRKTGGRTYGTLGNIINYTNSNKEGLRKHLDFYGKMTTDIDISNITNFCNGFKSTSIKSFELNVNNVKPINMFSCFANCTNLIDTPQFNTINTTNLQQTFSGCNNLSNASIQNIVNMCLNSNVSNKYKALEVTNLYSPLYNTKFDNSYYQNRLTELQNAGWSY